MTSDRTRNHAHSIVDSSEKRGQVSCIIQVKADLTVGGGEGDVENRTLSDIDQGLLLACACLPVCLTYVCTYHFSVESIQGFRGCPCVSFTRSYHGARRGTVTRSNILRRERRPGTARAVTH